MNYNVDQQMKKTARVRSLYMAALVLACAFGTVTNAAAQKITPLTTTPTLITPPAGNSAFLLGHAVGTQGYVCLPKGTGASWTVNNARPEATLFAWLCSQRQRAKHQTYSGSPKPVLSRDQDRRR